MANRWNLSFNVPKYHSSYLQFYEEFFKHQKNPGLVVDRILELLDDVWLHYTSYHLYLSLNFINENCTRLLTDLMS